MLLEQAASVFKFGLVLNRQNKQRINKILDKKIK